MKWSAALDIALAVLLAGGSSAAATDTEFRPSTTDPTRSMRLQTTKEQDSSELIQQQEHHLRRLRQTDIENYHIWSSEEIESKLKELADKYPDFVRLSTTQDRYGLPRAGGPNDCPFVDGDGCPNSFLEIQDFKAHPEGSDSSNRLPEVFWSGCLHGNERVGPTAVMEAAILLLESAQCEMYVAKDPGGKGDTCLDDLASKGIDIKHRQWLSRLVTTRRIVMMPTSNSLGYFRNQREEDGIDPNRDFPFDVQHANECMRTVAGRSLNEIFRDHMFQLSLTYHGGMEVIGYEWGAPTYLNYLSPDDTAQAEIAAAYSRYGGAFKSSPAYKYGTMNDEVYFVRGGFEDWACKYTQIHDCLRRLLAIRLHLLLGSWSLFHKVITRANICCMIRFLCSDAGSWDPDRVLPCEPTTFDGYPKEKSVYNDATLRAFNMLVETSDQKLPPPKTLGSSLNVMDADTAGNGHVSRNIRLALLSADLVQPYVGFLAAGDLPLKHDIIPTEPQEGKSCKETRSIDISEKESSVTVEWTVGGALSIDKTEVWFAKWDDLKDDQIDCASQDPDLTGFTNVTLTSASKGTGAFSENGPSPTLKTLRIKGKTIGPVFTAKLDLPSGMQISDKFVVIAKARVDQDWGTQPKIVKPDRNAQSHIANARTNPDWHYESAGKVIQGRKDWYSPPLTLNVVSEKDEEEEIKEEEAEEKVEREEGLDSPSSEDTSNIPTKSGTKTSGTENEEGPLSSSWGRLFIFLGVSFTLICCCNYCRKSDRRRIKTSEIFEEDDDFIFDSKPYSDAVDDEYMDDDSVDSGDIELS